ncbi:hypothetical protein AKO1_003823, partial [Acrasis kona]
MKLMDCKQLPSKSFSNHLYSSLSSSSLSSSSSQQQASPMVVLNDLLNQLKSKNQESISESVKLLNQNGIFSIQDHLERYEKSEFVFEFENEIKDEILKKTNQNQKLTTLIYSICNEKKISPQGRDSGNDMIVHLKKNKVNNNVDFFPSNCCGSLKTDLLLMSGNNNSNIINDVVLTESDGPLIYELANSKCVIEQSLVCQLDKYLVLCSNCLNLQVLKSLKFGNLFVSLDVINELQQDG